MKTLTNISLVLFALTASAQNDFSKYKWRNRIVVFSTTSLETESFVTHWQYMKNSTKKIEDRNIQLFVLAKGRLYDKDLKVVSGFQVGPLRQKYQIPNTYEGITLIGKDGGVKFQKTFPLDVKIIFETIDQMPMRKSEMRENIDD